jgi:hypothetical protein
VAQHLLPLARRYRPLAAFFKAILFGSSLASIVHFSASLWSPLFSTTTSEGLPSDLLASTWPFDTLVT